MPGEAGGRPLLPQTTQMSGFSFAPPTLAPRENQRNYVFVDEHNRHKRLKVMRACEGCRRRKIKCDAATTNAWPCAACIRLKLNCIPPTVSYDKDFAPGTHTFELQTTQDYAPATTAGAEAYQRHQPMQQSYQDSMRQISPATQASYADNARMYQSSAYISPVSHAGGLQYTPVTPHSMAEQDLRYTQAGFAPSSATTAAPTHLDDGAWRTDGASPEELSDAMGDLKISSAGAAPYLMSKKLADTPVQEEYEPEIPLPLQPSADLTIRIPPEMFPSEQQALQYFDYFFTNIHPYIPVVDRSLFYRQWHTARQTIPTLLLEAIFACASLVLEPQPQGNKWLALASKHEESYKDVPRLSTIQAMLLLLKAREFAPKRGYFYRSWTTIFNLVAMGKELELDQHLELHNLGHPCQSWDDCSTKSRVWNSLFNLELMIGGPQGRGNFAVGLDTIDWSVPRQYPGQDDVDFQTTRQHYYVMTIVRNIRRTNFYHYKNNKRKGWAADPEYTAMDQQYDLWLRDLPQDLQLAYPADGSPVWIPSHFIGNLHAYHYLSTIMHHRPQLERSIDNIWKKNMLASYRAAKLMCGLQEAVLHTFGMPGLSCMLRGISFTVYSVLTCTMLHLVCVTSPDPELNTDAREYFARHMRILEQCAPHFPMPEMQAQVNNLRQAFSADTNKAFELKPSFPYGSPPAMNDASPLVGDQHYRHRGSDSNQSMEQGGQVNYHAHPITPPISSNDSDPKADSPAVQSLVMMAAGQRQPQPTSALQSLQEPVQWNPTRIIDQFNVAFGTPPPTSSSQSSPPLRPPPPGNYELRTPQETQSAGFQPADVSPQQPHPVSNVHAQLPPPVSYAAPAGTYVTPSMWQDVVASSFTGGQKRGWDYGGPAMMDQTQMSKRSR